MTEFVNGLSVTDWLRSIKASTEPAVEGGTETEAIFNPYQNTNNQQPWAPEQSQLLQNTSLDPSTFRIQGGQTGGFQVVAGDNVISSFQDESQMQDFISQYTQGWQQRQNTRNDEAKWRDVVSKYEWQSPPITSPTVQTNTITTSDNQFIDAANSQIQGQPPQVNQTVAQTTKAPIPEEIQTALMDAVKSSPDMDTLLQTLGPIVGTLSQGSQVQAAQATQARESTVQGQLEDLMKSFEGGDPPWATGAMRTANAIMAQRGLSASSLAGKAITNAVMEAALPIAMADANMSAQFQFQNLSNVQQARIQNAQSFLQMDLANFSAAQQMQMFKAQEKTSALLSDTSAENASRQFNAASANQTNQFMSSLASQVQQFNAQQSNALEQFNAGQGNALEQFRAQMQEERTRFNAQNRLIIDQANAKWRQEVTTIDNATFNEANRINAANLLSVTLSEYNNLSQARRDAMNHAFTSSEGAKDRAVELVIAELREEAATGRAQTAAQAERSNSLFEAAGSLVASIFR